MEHWDERRKKWVLYKTQRDHAEDCERYPLEAIPRRIFLDTNVINLMVAHAELVFEGSSPPAGYDPLKTDDIEALMHIFAVGQRAGWDIMASRKTLAEVEATPDANLRAMLVDYAIQLVDTDYEASAYAATLGRQMIDAPFATALPDLADRELIGNAIGLMCDVFCTRDRRTIIRKRENLHLLPIRILTPREWWAHIKPWGGLFL